MITRVLKVAALIAALAVVLSGCGGGGGRAANSAATGTAPVETGSIKISVAWPTAQSKTIPMDTSRIVVNVAGTGMTAQTYQIDRNETTLTISNVPVGQRVIRAAAFSYSNYEESLSPSAVGRVDVTVLKNQTVSAPAIDLQPLSADQQALENGRNALNDMLFNGKGTADDAIQYFAQVTTPECSSEAKFGLAIAGLLAAQTELANKYPNTFSPPGGGGQIPIPSASASPVPLTGGIASGALDFSKLSQSLTNKANPFRALQPKSGLDVTTRAGSDDWSAIQADLKAILIPALDQAIGNLTIAESDPAFTFRLGAGWYYMSSGYTQYTVHVGDVYIFEGFLRAIKAEALMACAYSVNAGSFDFDAAQAALDANKDGILTPSEYMPASPFLTLIDANSMAAAKTELLAACDQAVQGLNLAIAEGNPNDWQEYDVIDWTLVTKEDLIGLRSIIAQVK